MSDGKPMTYSSGDKKGLTAYAVDDTYNSNYKSAYLGEYVEKNGARWFLSWPTDATEGNRVATLMSLTNDSTSFDVPEKVYVNGITDPRNTGTTNANTLFNYTCTYIGKRAFTKKGTTKDYTVNGATVHNAKSYTITVNGNDSTYYYVPTEFADDNELYWNETLKEVTLPSTIKEIGQGAFDGCVNLTSINYIPQSVEKIQWNAFLNCMSLEKLEFQVDEDGNTKLTRLPKDMLANCFKLKSLDIPEGITQIDNYAIQDCIAMTSIHLPKTLTTIGTHFLCRSKSLKTLVVPENVTSIAGTFLHGCESLRNVYLMGPASTLGATSIDKSTGASDPNFNFNKSAYMKWPYCGPVHDCVFWVNEEYWKEDYSGTGGGYSTKGDATVTVSYVEADGGSAVAHTMPNRPWAWLDGDHNMDGEIEGTAGNSDYQGRNNRYAFLNSKGTMQKGRWQTAIFYDDTDISDFGTNAEWARFTRAEKEEGSTTSSYYLYFTKQTATTIPAQIPVMLWVDTDQYSTSTGAYQYFKNPKQSTSGDDWLLFYGSWYEDSKAPKQVYKYTSTHNSTEVVENERVAFYGSAAPAPLFVNDIYYVWSNSQQHGNFKAVFDIDKAPKNGTGLFHCFWRVLKNGIPTAAQAKSGFTGEWDDDITSIEEISTENLIEDNGRIYDLSGRCVGETLDNLPKGIYIKNGKKIMKQ